MGEVPSTYNPEEDPNYLAYHRDLENGDLDNIEPGMFVAYFKGSLLASAETIEEMSLNEMVRQAKGPIFLQPAHIEVSTVDVPQPLDLIGEREHKMYEEFAFDEPAVVGKRKEEVEEIKEELQPTLFEDPNVFAVGIGVLEIEESSQYGIKVFLFNDVDDTQKQQWLNSYREVPLAYIIPENKKPL